MISKVPEHGQSDCSCHKATPRANPIVQLSVAPQNYLKGELFLPMVWQFKTVASDRLVKTTVLLRRALTRSR